MYGIVQADLTTVYFYDNLEEWQSGIETVLKRREESCPDKETQEKWQNWQGNRYCGKKNGLVNINIYKEGKNIQMLSHSEPNIAGWY